MLLRDEGDDGVLAIGQPAHAWVSGQLARAWGGEAFGTPEPREEVCLAADQHDVGMALYDLAPRLDPATGLPYPFSAMPYPTHLELWEVAPRRLLAQSRYAALLVSMHGEALYRLRDLGRLPPEEAARIRDYLTGQQALQAELAADLGADPEQLRRNQRLLWTWDFLSLALCLGWAPCSTPETPAAGEPVALRLEPSEDSPIRFTLDPWPFEPPALTVHTEGRRLTGRFTDEAALHLALSRAQGETLVFELVPA
jgi:Protein of unknown function (DUF3891)